MPCSVCNSIYEYPPMKLIDKVYEVYTDTRYSVKHFDLLNKKCPCINCLVKIMCIDDRHSCLEYLQFLFEVCSDLFYIE